MSKPAAMPLRIGMAVLAEDLSDGVHRPRREDLTWVRRPDPEPPVDDDPTGEVEQP